ncbi:hypothetical protein [Kutzneria sp. NPDC052558]|uniref:hypothetical protein n=1 Tax=Kutzneria sp. NPDC052558 TaxID=3364121 RepID=UPI0037C59EEE
MEFFFDPIDDPDREQEVLAYQAFYRWVTWACVYCRGENTVQTSLLPEFSPHYREKVPSGVHYRVMCQDCRRVSHGFPPEAYCSGGGVETLFVHQVRAGQCVIGWGVVDDIRPSSTNPDKCSVVIEGGFEFDHGANDAVMIMNPLRDEWKLHAIPGSKWIGHDAPTTDETADTDLKTAEAATGVLGYAELHDRLELVIAEHGDRIVVWTDGTRHPPCFTAEGEPFTLLGHVLHGLGVGPELIADLGQPEDVLTRDVFAAAGFALTEAAADLVDMVVKWDYLKVVPGDPSFRWSECIRHPELYVRPERVPQDFVTLAEVERERRPGGPPRSAK